MGTCSLSDGVYGTGFNLCLINFENILNTRFSILKYEYVSDFCFFLLLDVSILLLFKYLLFSLLKEVSLSACFSDSSLL